MINRSMLKPLNSACFFMGNDGLSSKQVGQQTVTRRLDWIKPVCISINAVQALKGLTNVTLNSALETDIPFYVK